MFDEMEAREMMAEQRKARNGCEEIHERARAIEERERLAALRRRFPRVDAPDLCTWHVWDLSTRPATSVGFVETYAPDLAIARLGLVETKGRRYFAAKVFRKPTAEEVEGKYMVLSQFKGWWSNVTWDEVPADFWEYTPVRILDAPVYSTGEVCYLIEGGMVRCVGHKVDSSD